jgi:hypothetical protein
VVFEAKWLQGWADGLSTYMAVAAVASVDSQDYLYFWKNNGGGDGGNWVVAGGPYDPAGQWQSFAWGDSCIFNNGINAPQIYNPNTALFEDLPNWGMISNAEDLGSQFDDLERSVDTKAACTVILPFKNFLVALGVTESGLYRPNTVWWSNASSLVGYNKSTDGTGGPPDWDYPNPGSLSGKNEVGVGDGALTWGNVLNENLVCFTDGSATAMTLTGGSLVMGFRRLFNKGCAGLNLSCEFNNRLFVLSRDQIYQTDGSTVGLIAKDRVEEEFFKRAGKGGRFKGGDIDFKAMQVIKNPDRKEIHLNFSGTVLPSFGSEPEYINEISAELMYQETEVTNRSHPTGVLGVSENKILANTGANKMMYSDDYGDTWTRVADFPDYYDNPGVFVMSKIIRHVETDAWYFAMYYSSNRECTVYRSLDNGLTYTLFFAGAGQRYGSNNIALDYLGRLVMIARGNDVWINRWNDPVNTIGGTASYDEFQDFHTGRADNCSEVCEIPGYGYAALLSSTGESYVHTIDYALVVQTPYWGGDFALVAVNWPHEMFLGKTIINELEPNNNSTRTALFENGSAVPLPEISYDFGEPIDFTRTETAATYFLTIASPGADNGKWLATWSTTTNIEDYTDPITILLPSAMDDNSGKMWAYNSTGDFWIGYYEVGTFTHIIRMNLSQRAIAKKTSLVYNYEDDNYTWMDASVDINGSLVPVNCMNYAFAPGAVVRWSDLLADQARWDGSEGTYIIDGVTRWSDFYQASKEQFMFWMTDEGVYRADQVVNIDGVKEYFVMRDRIDFDDIVSQWTTNLWKHMKQMYFHVQSPSSTGSGPNPFGISVGWATNLMDDPDWIPQQFVNLNRTATGGKHKWDFRSTGRYLAIKMTFNGTQEIKMSGCDMDIEERYGR